MSNEKSSQEQFGNATVFPVALGLISDPPTIVLTYDCVLKQGFGFGSRKRRKRKMPLRDFTDKSNVKRCTFNLRQRHNKYLSDVLDVTLEKMLRIIQEIQRGYSVEASVRMVDKEYSIDPDEDMNTLSPAELARRKAMMDEAFRKTLVRPGDPGYVYDKVISFETEKEATNEWDEEENSESRNENDAPCVIDQTNQKLEFTDHLDLKESESNAQSSSHLKLQSPNIENTSLLENKEKNVSNDKPVDKLTDDGSALNINDTELKLDKLNLTPRENHDELRAEHEPGLKSVTNKIITEEHKESEEESTHGIEEALINIEAGEFNDDEDEDFWK